MEEDLKSFALMSFGSAMARAGEGKKIARHGWNGRGIFVELQSPDANSKMTHPYFYIDTTGLESDYDSAPRVRVPWAPSQTDMLALDWCVVA